MPDTICDDPDIQAKLCEIANTEERLNNRQNELQAKIEEHDLEGLRDDISQEQELLNTLRAELIDLIKQFRDQEEAEE